MDLQGQLARIAHRLWVDKMHRAGWRYGEQYDEARLLHDALVPFEQLSRRHRLELQVIVESDPEVADMLARVVQYSHGPARLFLIEEMTIGLEVVLFPLQIRQEVGTVVGWTTDSEGELDKISVRWQDRTVVDHHSWLMDLARADEVF